MRQPIVGLLSFLFMLAAPVAAGQVQTVSLELSWPQLRAAPAEPGRGVLTRWSARLALDRVSLEEALAALREHSGVPLAFSPSRVSGYDDVSCDCEAATVGEALDRILGGTPFGFVETPGRILVTRSLERPGGVQDRLRYALRPRPGIVATPRMVTANPSRAQETGTITGRVIDERTLAPLAAVQMSVDGLQLGTITQQNGQYLLVGVPAGTHTLTAQRVGYEAMSEEVTVATGESVSQNFSLAEQALALDEIVVTGTPGGTQRRALGNSLEDVDAAVLTERVAITQMKDLMEGRTPGVDFTSANGEVGAGSAIRIRGYGSLSLDQTPLIYIDGIRVRNDLTVGPGTNAGPAASTLNDLNPDDIESIEVVKGAAAATLYGTEASAGVIQIITKRGQQGDPQFDFTVRQGTNFMKDPAGRLGTQWGCRTGDFPCAEADLFSFNILDHEEQVTGESPFGYGHTQDYDLSVVGGTQNFRYYASAGWSDHEGITPYNWDEKFTGRVNITAVPSENLTLDLSTGFVDGASRFETGFFPGGIWGNALFSSPTPEELAGPSRGWYQQTPEEVGTAETTRDYQRLTGSITAQHTFGGWLNQRAVLGIDRAWDQNREFAPRHPLGSVGPFQADSRGLIDISNPIETNLSMDYSASAEYVHADWLSFLTSVGGQYYSESSVTTSILGREFTSPFVNDLGGATAFDPPDQAFFDNKSFGIYVQEQIGINDRVFLTAAVRGDDNSAFGDEFDIIYYPKLSGTWVVSEEPFFDAANALGFVTELRFRGAWGQAGRQPGVIAGATLYETSLATGGRQMLAIDNIGNPEVGAERTSEIELGFDVALFNNRVSFDFTYFDQTVTDALSNQSLLPSDWMFGYGDRQTNLAELSITGWEASTNFRVIQRDNLALDIFGSGDFTTNHVVSLGPNVIAADDFFVGGPYPSMVDSSHILSFELDANGRPINIMCDSGAGPGGRYLGGPPKPCSEVPMEMLLGRGNPTYRFSVAPTLTLFNNLQIFSLFNGEHGAWVADDGVGHRSEFSDRINSRAALLRTDPWLIAALDIPGLKDDRWRGRYDVSFWKLRELGFRYTAPDSWARVFGGENLSLGLTAREVWTLWQKTTHDRSGVRMPDPEIKNSNPNADWSHRVMPPLSNITFTARISM